MNGMDRSSTVDGESPRAVEANRKLVRRFVAAVWNGEDLDAIQELATADLVVHALGADVDRTREAFLEFHTGLLDAVPDLEHVVEDVVAESDRVVVHATIRGTPESQYGVLAPTGESFETVGFQKYRIEGGRIAEVWVLPNAMGMLRQLRIFPDSPGKVLRLLVGAVRGRLVGR
jgi:Predicted ester cyclase